MTQQKMVNPFRHHHDHHHDHDHDHNHDHDHDHGDPHHDHGPDNQLDPAQQSLADALRVSFFVLKLVMALMVVLYLGTNIFSVASQEVAVRLRFGKIVGEGDARVIRPGGPYFAMPYPFEQVLRIPTSSQQVELVREFWWDIPTGDPLGVGAAKMTPLNPEHDGANITGDKNIVHTKWSVTYHIENPVDFVTNVNDNELANRLIVNATQEGVFFALARLEADQVIRSQVNSEKALDHTQKILDGMQTGLKIDRLQMTHSAMPGPVKEAYKAVLDAESEKAKNLEAAQQDHDRIMGETAGEAHRPLWKLIREYDRAYAKGDAQEIRQRDEQLDQIFRDLRLPQDLGAVAVSGKVAETINEARNYKNSIVANLRAEANTFQSFYGVYKGNESMRRIVIGRLTQDFREAVFTGDVETIRLPGSAAKYIELNRDPIVNAKRQEDQLKERRNRRGQ